MMMMLKIIVMMTLKIILRMMLKIIMMTIVRLMMIVRIKSKMTVMTIKLMNPPRRNSAAGGFALLAASTFKMFNMNIS